MEIKKFNSYGHVRYLFFLSMFLFLSCTAPGILEKVNQADITKNGFINDNCFQVIVKEPPDNRFQSLVERRESAYFKVKENLASIVINKIIDYTLSYTIKNKDSKFNRTEYSHSFRHFLSYGTIAEEFYEEDDSVVIIYRITKKNLKNELLSIEMKNDLKNNSVDIK